MSDSMHPQRAQVLLGDSSQPPEGSSLPPGISPPPGFGGVQLVPAQAPPVQSPPQQDQPAGRVSSPPHPSEAHVPLNQGLLQAPPGYGGHPPFQGPPFGPPGGHMVPPFPHHPHHPHFPPHMPHMPQGIPFHPGMAPPGFQPGFPGAPHFPGPFGPGGFPPRPGMQFPPQAPFAQPPFASHVPPTMSPAAAAPRAEGKPPQIQMITPQLNRSGIPVEVEGQMATPQPLPGDNQPLQFKSNAAPQAQVNEEDSCWTETTSDEGSVYYYNTKTMETTWDVPKGYKVKSKPKPVSWETLGDGTWKKVILDNDQHYYFNTKTKASVWTVPPEVQAILDEQEREREKEKESEQNNDDGDIEEREAKKQKTENGESTLTPEEEAAAAEAAAAAAKISEEEHKKNVEIFREMLREYKVAPFTKWEKELPKFVGDPRFQLLPRHSERRAVFDQFVRHRLEDEKREKKERIKAAQESFRQMLSEFETKFHEAVENSNFSIFSISEFENFVKDDERWKNVDQKDRESLFAEFLVPFKQEIEEKKKDELEKAKADFVELLKENSVNFGAKWDRTKVKIDRDARYKHPLLQTTDKETIFKDYLASLEADSAKRKKREREEASKRDREREVREMRERGNRELDKRREQLKREEEEANYRALLSEKIKEANMSWKDAIKLIDSDPRFRAHHLLRDDKDRMFEDHMKSLLEKRIKDFKSLLFETIFDISIDWKHAKDLLRDDRRYSRLPSEREREATFDKHIQEIRKKARESFRELLRETKSITANTIMDSPEFEQIKESIRPDKRYANWNDEKSERDKMFKEHIEELQKEQAARPSKKLVVVDEET